MTTASVAQVAFKAGELIVELADGRVATAPVDRFPRLQAASPDERANWQPCGGGAGIHWPDIDEDVSVESLLRA
jgi:hypothetical protein